MHTAGVESMPFDNSRRCLSNGVPRMVLAVEFLNVGISGVENEV